ncbi:hypothetical protein ACFOLF_01875 [Paenibacillus sepulcri]|uniref:Preprotein translocase subunit Tim44 n=1 Tax=Paenibacillus sepulcri TaxID=359917 RepID=A0ABS7C071_9BACL|nr:hypothetical protein [Paenibacillus sepulcri]
MKKGLMLFMAFTLFFAVSVGSVDAKRGGGFKSPRQGFTQHPAKNPDSGINKSTGGTSGAVKSGTAATTKRGFFSGGSLMRGLMIGGLAGLLFGGIFGGMGFLGNFLGLIINVLAIYILIAAIRGIIHYFRNRRRPSNPNNRGSY